ncbi:YbfB/YjiJ family MFS transporter [Epibacterium ulvae]|uniref:MFS transporter n=1 Tax=Epibacterium ulvae TaxID=1156985 RepID=UPI001BFC1E1C|nr:YbfB/YjiJ family MFS transporter [Epibacterium ulvae]MBT8155761.1 YbfB/YjiJ family MFS transporter [Epibacterium ulvae]
MKEQNGLSVNYRLHPAWRIAFACAVCVFCGLGLGRFAFGIMLPSMSTSLGLSYGQGSMLGFANLLGYLVSVLVVPSILRRWGTRNVVTGSLFIMALTMAAMAVTDGYFVLCLLYLLTGIGSGGVVLPSMSIMSQWFAPSHRGMAAGIVMSGPGFGIILTGFIVPNLMPFGELQSWQTGWLVFGLFTVAIGAFAYSLIRNHPNDLGVERFGQAAMTSATQVSRLDGRAHMKLLVHLGLIFGIYGATYMIYVTFIVTSMMDRYGMTEDFAGWLWAFFGLLSVFSGIVFGWISDWGGRRLGLVVSFAVLATSYLLVGFSESSLALYASVTLFGIAAWSVPVIMAAATGDYFGPAAAASALAISMIVFSVGQSVGPVVAGYLAEQSGDFTTSYSAAGLAAIFAVVLTLLLHAPETVE